MRALGQFLYRRLFAPLPLERTLWIVALFLVALALRAGYVAMPDYKLGTHKEREHEILPTKIIEGKTFGDGPEYWRRAKTLLETGVYDRSAWRPPGYPVFMALCILLFGENVTALRYAEALLGALSVVLLYLCAERKARHLAGLLAAAGLAFHGFHIKWAASTYTENLTVFLLLVFLYVAERPPRHPDREVRRNLPWSALAALTAVLLCLTRPEFLLLQPFVVVGYLCFNPQREYQWRRALCYSLVFFALYGPWVVRNSINNGGLVLATTNSGLNLLIGNHPRSDGRWVAENQRLTPDQQKIFREAKGMLARDRLYRQFALEHIRHNPIGTLRNMARKFERMYLLPDEHIMYQQGVFGYRLLTYPMIRPLVVFGMIVSLFWLRGFFLIIAVVGVNTLVVLAFIITDYRQPLVMLPALLVLAGSGVSLGISWLLEAVRSAEVRVKARRHTVRLAGLASLLALSLALHHAMNWVREVSDYTGPQVVDLAGGLVYDWRQEQFYYALGGRLTAPARVVSWQVLESGREGTAPTQGDTFSLAIPMNLNQNTLNITLQDEALDKTSLTLRLFNPYQVPESLPAPLTRLPGVRSRATIAGDGLSGPLWDWQPTGEVEALGQQAIGGEYRHGEWLLDLDLNRDCVISQIQVGGLTRSAAMYINSLAVEYSADGETYTTQEVLTNSFPISGGLFGLRSNGLLQTRHLRLRFTKGSRFRQMVITKVEVHGWPAR